MPVFTIKERVEILGLKFSKSQMDILGPSISKEYFDRFGKHPRKKQQKEGNKIYTVNYYPESFKPLLDMSIKSYYRKFRKHHIIPKQLREKANKKDYDYSKKENVDNLFKSRIKKLTKHDIETYGLKHIEERKNGSLEKYTGINEKRTSNIKKYKKYIRERIVREQYKLDVTKKSLPSCDNDL